MASGAEEDSCACDIEKGNQNEKHQIIVNSVQPLIAASVYWPAFSFFL
jgi:hypothetical protein